MNDNNDNSGDKGDDGFPRDEDGQTPAELDCLPSQIHRPQPDVVHDVSWRFMQVEDGRTVLIERYYDFEDQEWVEMAIMGLAAASARLAGASRHMLLGAEPGSLDEH